MALRDGLCDQVPPALLPTHQGMQSDHLVDIDLLSGLNLHELLLFLQSRLGRESDTQVPDVVAADCNTLDSLGSPGVLLAGIDSLAGKHSHT